jgi:Domain of unknown function (DUF4190)
VRQAFPMVDPKPTAWSAVASLGCGILACVVALALPAIYSHGLHVETTGVTAGIAAGIYGLLSLVLGLPGVACGIVALRRVRRGEGSGRGVAWAGIVLSCLPSLVLLGYLIPGIWEELRIRFVQQPEKPG